MIALSHRYHELSLNHNVIKRNKGKSNCDYYISLKDCCVYVCLNWCLYVPIVDFRLSVRKKVASFFIFRSKATLFMHIQFFTIMKLNIIFLNIILFLLCTEISYQLNSTATFKWGPMTNLQAIISSVS